MKTEKVKKEKVVKTPAVKLVSYSMRMVIPTGNYANIQPEIIVQAGTVEDAHNYIAPHMNKLWKEYYLISERRPEPKKVVVTPAPVVETPAPVAPVIETKVVEAPAPATSVAFAKAQQAIMSATSLDALDLIRERIEVSVKLTDEDKVALEPIREKRISEIVDSKLDNQG